MGPKNATSFVLRRQAVSVGMATNDRFGMIEVHEDLASIRPLWERFHRQNDGSPYQSYRWFSAWFDELGASSGWSPCVVVARDEAGVMTLLIPLVWRRRFGATIVEFAGDKHSNLNIPLTSVASPGLCDKLFLPRLISALGSVRSGAIVLRLLNMPAVWRDRDNPLMAYDVQSSSSNLYATTLDAALEMWACRILSPGRRRRLDHNLRKLGALGEIRWLESVDAFDSQRIIEAFVDQKNEQLKSAGIRTPFRDVAFRRFLHNAATNCRYHGAAALKMFAIEIDGVIVAVLGATSSGRSFSVMFLSFAKGSRAAKLSPGEILLWHTIQTMHSRGLRHFDLGIGDAAYKKRYCPDVVPLYDLFAGHSVGGFVIATALCTLATCKRWLKRRVALLAMVRATLRLLL